MHCIALPCTTACSGHIAWALPKPPCVYCKVLPGTLRMHLSQPEAMHSCIFSQPDSYNGFHCLLIQAARGSELPPPVMKNYRVSQSKLFLLGLCAFVVFASFRQDSFCFRRGLELLGWARGKVALTRGGQAALRRSCAF